MALGTKYPLAPPALGSQIDGHMLFAFTSRGEGMGVGLFASTLRSWHLYVCWDLYWHDGGWRVERGDYSQTLSYAVESYVLRGGLTSGETEEDVRPVADVPVGGVL